MYCLCLLNSAGDAMIIVGPEDRVLFAVTYGTTFDEVRRMHGPMRHMTVEEVTKHVRRRWKPQSVTVQEIQS